MLQRVLFENRDVLDRHSILYPDVSLRGYGHHDLAFLLGGGYPSWATPQPRSLEDLEAELRQRIEQHQGSVLLSSEDFYLCPNPEALFETLTGAGTLVNRTPAVIVYIRRQDDAHESWFNQTIKAQGYTHEIDASIEEFWPLWDYEKNLARWESVFGRENMIVRPYASEEFRDASLLSDFLAILGLDSREFDAPIERVNTSLNRDLLEFQRIANRLPVEPRLRRLFHRQLMQLNEQTRGSGLFDERPLLDATRRASIVSSYINGNNAVARRYLDREALFAPVAQDTATPVRSDGLSVEKLAAIFGWLLMHHGNP